MRLDIFTLFPESFDWFQSQRPVQNALEHGQRAAVLRLPRHDATGGRAGRRRAVRRRGWNGPACRRRRCGAPGCVCERGEAARRAAPPSGRLLDDELADELAAEPHVALLVRALRGLRPAGSRAPRRRRGLDRSLRAGWRRAAGDGDRRRGDAEAARRPRARRSAIEESFSRVLEGAPEYPHYTRPRAIAAGRCPRCLLSGDHARVRELAARSRVAPGLGSSSRTRSSYHSATARSRCRVRRFFSPASAERANEISGDDERERAKREN